MHDSRIRTLSFSLRIRRRLRVNLGDSEVRLHRLRPLTSIFDTSIGLSFASVAPVVSITPEILPRFRSKHSSRHTNIVLPSSQVHIDREWAYLNTPQRTRHTAARRLYRHRHHHRHHHHRTTMPCLPVRRHHLCRRRRTSKHTSSTRARSNPPSIVNSTNL